MIVLKFTKYDTSSLAAHVDTLRAITYLFRRAQLNATYSQGFNPHMDLGFSPPLPLGVESDCEYVSVKADFSADILSRLNAVCPKGLSFTRVWQIENINLASKIDNSTYVVKANGIGSSIEQILAPNYMLVSNDGDKVVQKDVSSRILDAQVLDENSALLTLKVGNENLRPDKLVAQVMQNNNLSGDYQIKKVYSCIGNIKVDDYLDSIQI